MPPLPQMNNNNYAAASSEAAAFLHSISMAACYITE
jgi:hypothetical protein